MEGDALWAWWGQAISASTEALGATLPFSVRDSTGSADTQGVGRRSHLPTSLGQPRLLLSKGADVVGRQCGGAVPALLGHA